MSARSKAIQRAMAETRGAIVFGRSHVVVLGDREIVRQLPDMLATKLRDDIDVVTVRLAGQQETVADCLATAIREARGDQPRGRSRSRLALLIPDALAIPAASLRSLHDLSSRLGAHRLVLLVDREGHNVDDPIMEVVARMGAPVSKVEIDLPAPEPVVVPTIEDLLGTSVEPAPAAPASEPDAEPELEPAVPAPKARPVEAKRAPEAPRAAGRVQRKPQASTSSPKRSSRGAGLWSRVVTGGLVACVAACVAAFVAAPGIVTQVQQVVEAEPVALGLGSIEETPAAPEPSDSVPPDPTPDPVAAPEANRSLEPAPVSPRNAKPPADSPAPVRKVAPAPAASPEPAARKTRAAPSKTKPTPKPASRRKPAPAPLPLVRVNFNAVPWADLVVDGRPLGPTPLADVSLSQGEHEVRATFPDGRVVRRRVRVDSRHTRFRIQ